MDFNLIFIWLALMMLLKPSSSFQTMQNDYLQTKVTRAFAIIAFLPIFYFAVFGPVRGDVWMYLRTYRSLPTSFDGIIRYLKRLDDSHLFWAAAILIRNLTGANNTAFRLAVGLVQSIAIISLYRRYSDDYLLSLYLVVASGVPLMWMMNGIRQFVAVAIIVMATPWMLEKKYIKVCIVILIAALVHKTAIIMLPVVFVAQGQAWNWKTMVAILGAIVATYILSSVSGAYETMMDTAGYDMRYYVSDDGTNPIRVLVSFVPVALAFIAKRQLAEEDIPIINLSINMSIIAFGVYLVSMVTSGILVGRVPIYMSLYNFILLPYLVKRVFSRSFSKLLTYGMVGFYGLYYLVQFA